MKKGFLAGLAIAMVVLTMFVSCSKKAAGTGITTRILTDATGIDDKSFNASAWRGIERFYDNTSLRDKSYSYVTAQSQDQYIPNLNNAADEDISLIIASGFTWSDSIKTVASQHPNQKFMLIDAAGVNLPNVVETLFAEEMGSYLVGVIAAEQAKAEGIENPGFGFVGGVPGATITKFEMGYVQGVRSVFPNARIVDYYANNWGAPEMAKAQAKNWFDSGIYCIFSAAGSTGNGVIAQAKEERAKGKKVWAIGVDSDQFEDGLYNSTDSAVLTSMLKKVENATFQILTELKDGKFISGIRVFDLSIDAVGYSDRNVKMAKTAKDAAEKAKKNILSGKVVVEKTFAGAKAKGLVPASLHAVDD